MQPVRHFALGIVHGLSRAERVVICILGAMALATGVRAIFVPAPARSMAQLADQSLTAFLKGDGDRLYDHVLPLELQTTGLSRAKFHSMIDWASGCVRGYRPVGEPVYRIQGAGEALEAAQHISNGTTEGDLSVVVFTTPEGFKLCPSWTVLDALTMKYRGHYSDKPIQAQYWYALREGIRSERPTLDKLGTCLTQSGYYNAALLSWQSLEEGATRAINHFDPAPMNPPQKAYESRRRSIPQATPSPPDA